MCVNRMPPLDTALSAYSGRTEFITVHVEKRALPSIPPHRGLIVSHNFR
jgi:hypothetical protein